MAEAARQDSVLETTGASARIARVYAEALMQAAGKAGQLDAVGDELSAFVGHVLDGHPRIAAFLASTAINRKAKGPVLEQALGATTSELFRKFAGVLNENGRLGLLRAIDVAYRRMRDEASGRVRVRVTSAAPLSAEQTGALSKTLSQSLNAEPVLDARVNPDILGGLVVQVGDKVYDTSVRARLDNLRTKLLTSGTYGSA